MANPTIVSHLPANRNFFSDDPVGDVISNTPSTAIISDNRSMVI
jgi:hypothetical protein